ncbi:MAG: adenosine kinase, partial [Gammaproteobacteria bacterium]
LLDKSYTGVTGKCLVFVTPDADRTMNTFLGASADLNVDDIDIGAIRRSNYVYIEGYLVSADGTRQAAIRAREIAEKSRVKTALSLSDPNMVIFFRQGIEDMLGSGVDLLFANEDEACELVQTKDLDAAVQGMKDVARTFAITRGKKGALLYDGSELIHIDPRPVEAIDTLGAGDSFAGAFLYGLSQGMSFRQSGNLASMASSRIVTQYGPRLSTGEMQSLKASFNAGN